MAIVCRAAIRQTYSCLADCLPDKGQALHFGRIFRKEDQLRNSRGEYFACVIGIERPMMKACLYVSSCMKNIDEICYRRLILKAVWHFYVLFLCPYRFMLHKV